MEACVSERLNLGTHYGITDREREILDLIVENRNREDVLRYVGSVLRISESAVKNALYRLRLRYDKSMGFCREYREYLKKMPRRRYL
jgi:DNA-binding CsgD family transcriptional regulator